MSHCTRVKCGTEDTCGTETTWDCVESHEPPITEREILVKREAAGLVRTTRAANSHKSADESREGWLWYVALRRRSSDV